MDDLPQPPAEQPPASEFLTVEDVAAMLSVSVRTVWRLAESGGIPAPKRFSRRIIRWNRKELMAALGLK